MDLHSKYTYYTNVHLWKEPISYKISTGPSDESWWKGRPNLTISHKYVLFVASTSTFLSPLSAHSEPGSAEGFNYMPLTFCETGSQTSIACYVPLPGPCFPFVHLSVSLLLVTGADHDLWIDCTCGGCSLIGHLLVTPPLFSGEDCFKPGWGIAAAGLFLGHAVPCSFEYTTDLVCRYFCFFITLDRAVAANSVFIYLRSVLAFLFKKVVESQQFSYFILGQLLSSFYRADSFCAGLPNKLILIMWLRLIVCYVLPYMPRHFSKWGHNNLHKIFITIYLFIIWS